MIGSTLTAARYQALSSETNMIAAMSNLGLPDLLYDISTPPPLAGPCLESNIGAGSVDLKSFCEKCRNLGGCEI